MSGKKATYIIQVRAHRPERVAQSPALENAPRIGPKGDDVTKDLKLSEALEDGDVVAFEARLDRAGEARVATADDSARGKRPNGRGEGSSRELS